MVREAKRAAVTRPLLRDSFLPPFFAEFCLFLAASFTHFLWADGRRRRRKRAATDHFLSGGANAFSFISSLHFCGQEKEREGKVHYTSILTLLLWLPLSSPPPFLFLFLGRRPQADAKRPPNCIARREKEIRVIIIPSLSQPADPRPRVSNLRAFRRMAASWLEDCVSAIGPPVSYLDGGGQFARARFSALTESLYSLFSSFLYLSPNMTRQ